MGQTFGSMNASSTDPNKGLTGGQMFARKAVAGSLAGMGQGLQGKPITGINFGQPQPPTGPQGIMTPAPPVNPVTAGAAIAGNSNPFPSGPRQKPMNRMNLYG